MNPNNCTPDSNYSFSTDPNDLAAFPPVTVKLFFWGIQKTDGTVTITPAEIQQAFQILSDAFADSNICFVMEEQGYDYIVDNDMYNPQPTYSTLSSYINLHNLDKNAINIYVPEHIWRYLSNGTIGDTRGVAFGYDRVFYRKNVFPENPGILVHEIGHALGLRHTWSGYESSNCEAVTRNPNDPDYNADCAGDAVTDTNAMPMFAPYDNNHPIDTNCNYTGTGKDCHGDDYTITQADVKNYMGYPRQDCRQLFTTGQKIRMRETMVHPNRTYYSNIIEANPTTDLVIYDGLNDSGLEPNYVTDHIWYSTDIWVRNQSDGFVNQQHQDLLYNGPQDLVFVYVRINNTSCVDFSGNGQLKLYWSKGGLSQDWSNAWINATTQGLQTGDEVGTQSIPAISAGESVILEFPWQPHNPDVYENAGFQKPWMFCFLARIVSTEDPMTFQEGSNAAHNARYNNNIAFKNTTAINASGVWSGGSIFAGNLGNDIPIIADIRFYTNNPEDGNIWEHAEISVDLDDELWNRWQQSGGEATNIEIIDEEEYIIRLLGNNARLNNLPFGAEEWDVLTVGANFLIDEVDVQENYSLHVAQLSSDSQEAMGGFTYEFRRDNGRQEFQAGSSSDFQGTAPKLAANDINEQATYNWYDVNGNLVHTGREFTLSNSVSESYKLEVIADSDGHKDYHDIDVDDLRKIHSVSPNPASTAIDVKYFAGNCTSAYLSITSVALGKQDNYVINTQNTTHNIDLNLYSTGMYIVSLVCDGNVIDSKNLVIE